MPVRELHARDRLEEDAVAGIEGGNVAALAAVIRVADGAESGEQAIDEQHFPGGWMQADEQRRGHRAAIRVGEADAVLAHGPTEGVVAGDPGFRIARERAL